MAARRVAFVGDSITQGFGITTKPWPQLVQQRRVGENVAVANMAVSGEKIAAIVNRYTNQVVGHGYTTVVFGPTTNDLPDGTSGATIYAALLAAVQDALDRGLEVLVCTTLPRKNAASYSAALETQRGVLNGAIRAINGDVTGGVVTVVDMDAGTRDAGDPLLLDPALDSGDFLHPNGAGHVAMADQFDADASW